MNKVAFVLFFSSLLCLLLPTGAQISRPFSDYLSESQGLDVRYGALNQQVWLLEVIIDKKETGFWYRDGGHYIELMSRKKGIPVKDILQRYGMTYSQFSNYDTICTKLDSIGLFKDVGAALFNQVAEGKALVLDSLVVSVTKEASIYSWLWYTPKSEFAPWQSLYVSYVIHWKGEWINPLSDKMYDSPEQKLAFTQNIIDTYLNEKTDE